MGAKGLLVDYEWCSGCHTCEVACQLEHGYPSDQWGIKVHEVGPWEYAPKTWQYSYLPAPTDQCDLCADRVAKGHEPTCVKAPAESERKDLEESAGAKENPEKHGVLWGYLAPLSLLSAVMFFLVGGATDAFNAFTIPFLNVENGWTEGAANLCATIAAAGMLVGGTAMGLVLARTKDKGLLLFIDMLVCAIGLFLWFNLDIGVVGTYVIAFVLGCFLGAAPTVFFAMAPEVARSPKTVGAATAVVVLGQNGGTLAVPAIVGMILDSAGYGAAAMAMGGLSLAACVICLLVFRRIYNKSIRSTRE